MIILARTRQLLISEVKATGRYWLVVLMGGGGWPVSRMAGQSSGRLASLERSVESAMHASLACLLRSYDGVR